MVKAVILDLDGTLINSHDAHVKSYIDVFNSLGLSVDAEVLSKKFGMVAEDIARELFPGRGEAWVKHVVALKRKAFLNYLDSIVPQACANDFLLALSKKYYLAIATSTSKHELVMILKKFGWLDYFKVLLTSYEVANPKPAPDLLLRAAKDFGFSVSDCLFVGDSIYDALSAKSAGMPFFGVETGSYDSSDFAKLGFKSFPDLCSLVKKLI